MIQDLRLSLAVLIQPVRKYDRRLPDHFLLRHRRKRVEPVHEIVDHSVGHRCGAQSKQKIAPEIVWVASTLLPLVFDVRLRHVSAVMRDVREYVLKNAPD